MTKMGFHAVAAGALEGRGEARSRAEEALLAYAGDGKLTSYGRGLLLANRSLRGS